MPGTWQSQPVVIDGDNRDWPSPYPNYDSKARVAYATSNDWKNLYITMQTGDEMTQMKILKQGMVVSIDTAGKKEGQLNISYPLQNDNETVDITKGAFSNDAQSSFRGKQTEKKLDKLTKDANQYTTSGFYNCNGGFLVSQAAPCGIKVTIRMDEYKELVWEAVVPLKAIYNRDSITAADAGKPISVCFSVKGFKYPETKTSDNSNTGLNNSMSAGGMGNGTMPIGGRRGSSNSTVNPMQQLYDNTKTWKQFGLAYQP